MGAYLVFSGSSSPHPLAWLWTRGLQGPIVANFKIAPFTFSPSFCSQLLHNLQNELQGILEAMHHMAFRIAVTNMPCIILAFAGCRKHPPPSPNGTILKFAHNGPLQATSYAARSASPPPLSQLSCPWAS